MCFRISTRKFMSRSSIVLVATAMAMANGAALAAQPVSLLLPVTYDFDTSVQCGILEGIAETLAQDSVGWTGTETDAAFETAAAVRALAKAQAAESAASVAN